MATEKFTNEKTVKVETARTGPNNVEDLSKFIPKQSLKGNKAFRIIAWTIILIIAVLSIAKAPYCGSYLDAYIFEFIFGNAKFVIYAFMLIICLRELVNNKKLNRIISKRFIIGWGLLIIAVVVVLAVIYQYINPDKYDNSSFNSFIHFGKLFTSYVDDFRNNVSTYINKINPFIWDISSGIIGNVITDLWGIILTVLSGAIALASLFVAILYMTNQTNCKPMVKFKKWISKKIGLEAASRRNNELQVNPEDVRPDQLQKSEIRQEAIQSPSQTPPISFLSETSLDNFLINKTEAKNYADIIIGFLKRFESVVQLQKIVVLPLLCEITIEVEKINIINDIFASQNEILSELKVDSFNVSYKGNIIKFEIKNTKPSKVSLKSICSLLKDTEQNKIIVGIDEKLNPLLININKKSNIVIAGMRGSGVSMLMTTMIISLAYNNAPKDLEIVILAASNEKSLKYLEQLPHLASPIKYESLEITNTLSALQKEIDCRDSLFKQAKVKTIESYNHSKKSDIDYLKNIVVLISNFNIISRTSMQNNDLIIDLLERGPSVGITTILSTNNIDNELLNERIYKQLDVKLIMKLEFEQESIQLLDSRRGIELFGNGDGYCFDSETDTHVRFQACYMNIEELTEVIKIIRTFYSVKSKFN